MSEVLSTLARVREIQKRVSRQAFASAERSRITQEDTVDSLQGRILRSHSGTSSPELWMLNQEHQFRGKLRTDLVKEEVVLQQRTDVAAQRRVELQEASREARVVELAIEAHEVQESLLERRADNKKIDDMAAVRWWRAQG